MSVTGPTKRCTVAFAAPEGQFLWSLELPRGATVAEVLARARAAADAQGRAGLVPWESASVGIFGEPCRREAVPRDGDRIEIYVPLRKDPKQARRERARGKRASGRAR